MKYPTRCLLLALIILPEVVTAQTTFARKGLLDLRQWDFSEKGPVNLNGEWEFYMSELVNPERFKKQTRPTKDYIDFPATWNDLSKSLRPGDGFATYHLKIVVKSHKRLALELPHFYSSYNLWINSKQSASNGKVGISEKTSLPQWLPQTILLNANTDTLDLVLQVSNFHHAKGGVREPIRLGESYDLTFKRGVALTGNQILFAALVLTSVIFIFLYLFVKSEIAVLYFAALCLTWGLRSVFSNLYLVTYYFPDFPWELCVKIEYITLYLVMIWAILFIASLFKNEVNTIFKYLLCACNLIFIGVTIFFKAGLYTQFLPVYLSFCAVLLIYITYVLIRAFVYERDGVWLMASCLFLGVIIFAYDIVAYEGFATFNPIIINFGYLIMFILMAMSILYQLGFLKKSTGQANILRYEDLYGSPKEVKR